MLFRSGDQRQQGTVQGADPAALADAVMLAVNTSLAPRFVAKPGAGSAMLVQVQGVNLERYAELGRVLDPFGPRLKVVDGDKITYQVTASPDQVRAQLGLAKLQEMPAEAPAAPVPVAPVATPGAAPAPKPQPFTGMRFRW